MVLNVTHFSSPTRVGLPSHKISDGKRSLGEILLEQHAISPADLIHARMLKAQTQARFGDILLAHRMVGIDDLLAAYALKFSAQIFDIDDHPPNTRLIDAFGTGFCVRHGILPWRRLANAAIVLTSRPSEFERLRHLFPDAFKNSVMALASEADIHNSLMQLRKPQMVQAAETRVAETDSCRTWRAPQILAGGVVILAILLTAFVYAPQAMFASLCIWAVFTLVLNMWLKAHAAFYGWKEIQAAKSAPPPSANITPLRKPVVSIMVPLFKEKEIATTLVKRLSLLTYPKHLLDIILVTEDNDTLTKATLEATDLPSWIRIVEVPKGTLRTKPRALNYALDFCRGSIIGVYDAEDAPAHGQIETVVTAFQAAPPEVACLQGILDFYNRHTNWLARCFSVEYATWFRMILPGLARLGFVIPLGGTTLFFRRDALEELGGWDAHNVTEDADLGVRLARRGYITQLIKTVTQEEANCRPWPWVKQRSRWLKGYAVTYGVHMRNPLKLLSDLGAWRFFGFQLLFLGALSQFVLAPVLWSFWALPLGLPHPLQGLVPDWGFWALSGVFALSECVTILVSMLAVSPKSHRDLIKWVPSLHLYYPLGAIASYKGLWELMVKPFYWDKTAHGIFPTHIKAAPK
jgi:cellulose synthase/poly-beta-1,6-N-acetylglucosamine synthase-like glycosyltransferase